MNPPSEGKLSCVRYLLLGFNLNLCTGKVTKLQNFLEYERTLVYHCTGTVEQTKQRWKPLYKIEFEFLKPNYLLSNNVRLTFSYSSAGIIRQDHFCREILSRPFTFF